MDILYQDNRIAVCLKPPGVLSTDEPGGMPSLLRAALGTDFTTAINAQAIVIGLCFANGLSPVAGKYGWWAGIVFGVLHYALVTSVPFTHGGFLLYNGGFTAALICFLFIPVMEMFFKTKDEKAALRANK